MEPIPASARAPLVLASNSPRRRELVLRVADLAAVRVANVDETQKPGESAVTYAARLARSKAETVAGSLASQPPPLPAYLVMGADTVVVLDGTILGKPADPEEALHFLDRLRNRRHTVITAVCVVHAPSGRRAEGVAHSAVWLRGFSRQEAEAYVATGDPLDKAGGYAIQHGGFAPVGRLAGSETNVIGLPVSLARRLVARLSPRRD